MVSKCLPNPVSEGTCKDLFLKAIKTGAFSWQSRDVSSGNGYQSRVGERAHCRALSLKELRSFSENDDHRNYCCDAEEAPHHCPSTSGIRRHQLFCWFCIRKQLNVKMHLSSRDGTAYCKRNTSHSSYTPGSHSCPNFQPRV